MKTNGPLFALRCAAAAMVALLSVSCATIPADGEAMECGGCRTMWIRLYPSSGAPGIYRLNHGEKRTACPRCEEFAVRFFETGELPRRCPQCGTRFARLPVDVTP